MTDIKDAAKALEALDQVRASEKRLADKTGHCPPLRHAAFGALFFVLVGSMALSNEAQLIATPLVLIGIALLIQWDRKRYGVFINGYRRGKTLPLTLALAGTMVGLLLAASHMRDQDFSQISKLGLATLAFAISVGFSVVWHRVYRRELTGKAG